MSSGTQRPVLWRIDERGVGRVILNRPEVGNAYDGDLIQGLLAAVAELAADQTLRVLVVSGNGRHFQAGADLKWIEMVRIQSPDENLRVSRATARAVDGLNRLRVPTVALVQGGCFGGGTGIVAACDVVVAASDAMFSISEVRWGLTAAIIIPQLADAMGVRALRRYALTGERFGAEEARRIGLVHEVVAPDQLEATGARVVGHLLDNDPDAVAETKVTVLRHAHGDLDPSTFEALVEAHAAKRQTAAAAEGLASFREKRAARWLNAGYVPPADSDVR
jgi:methylglutaconyl-CoA hydratase